MSDKRRLLTPEIIYNFIFLKLIRIDTSSIGRLGGGGPEYKRNKLGVLMVEICMNVSVPDNYKQNLAS